MKEKKPSFYIYLHQRLKDNCDQDGNIDYREVKMRIVNIKIPKHLIPKLLKELEVLNMGTVVNKFKFNVHGKKDV